MTFVRLPFPQRGLHVPIFSSLFFCSCLLAAERRRYCELPPNIRSCYLLFVEQA